jgi:Rps23 Pro-64 3,4-dihydroxylase Tpa1-like proline 4-hydroxylase
MTDAHLQLTRGSGGEPLWVSLRGVLSAAQREELMRTTLAESRWLVDASTGGRDDYRQAQVLYTVVDRARDVERRVGEVAADAFGMLGGELAPPRRVECQQTIYLDGGFYQRHTDSLAEEAAPRALTYVYYHHRVPKAFVGGELVLVDAAGEEHFVVPDDDLLVLFRSDLEHEVRPVSVASGHLGDARFSVNGWIWR